MLKRIILPIFLIFATLIMAPPGTAQEICRGGSVSNFSKLQPDFRYIQQVDVPEQEGKKPSYWKYRHQSLHERGIIDQIIKGTRSMCCGGADSGECRVSYVDRTHNRVMIDGIWCPMSSATKFTTVTGLLLDEEAVVCAGRSHGRENENPCPPAYCVGQRANFY